MHRDRTPDGLSHEALRLARERRRQPHLEGRQQRDVLIDRVVIGVLVINSVVVFEIFVIFVVHLIF